MEHLDLKAQVMISLQTQQSRAKHFFCHVKTRLADFSRAHGRHRSGHFSLKTSELSRDAVFRASRMHG